MECVRVKELLSEYIDDTLDHETRKTVEKHLSTCKGCAEELASLRSLVEELGSLEKVKPPADFLEQLHERLEAPSGFTRIVRKLFVPFHVKIPLELATATLLAVLVFSLFHTQMTEKPMIQTPLEQKAMESASAPTARIPARTSPLPQEQTLPQPYRSIPPATRPVTTSERSPRRHSQSGPFPDLRRTPSRRYS